MEAISVGITSTILNSKLLINLNQIINFYNNEKWTGKMLEEN